MRRRLPFIAVLLVSALMMSGCFVIRGFFWTVTKIKRGEKGVLVLHLKPAEEDKDKGYVFVLIGVTDFPPENPGDPNPPPPVRLVKPRKFDTKGKFGGPHSMIVDNFLRDEMLDSPWCSGANSSDTVRWVLVRTSKEIGDRGAINQTALTRLTFKAHAEATGVNPVRVFAGGWSDLDGDGTYTPDSEKKDQAGCATSISTSIPTGPAGPDPTRAQVESLLE